MLGLLILVLRLGALCFLTIIVVGILKDGRRNINQRIKNSLYELEKKEEEMKRLFERWR